MGSHSEGSAYIKAPWKGDSGLVRGTIFRAACLKNRGRVMVGEEDDRGEDTRSSSRGIFLVVKWLRLWASAAWGTGLIPGLLSW